MAKRDYYEVLGVPRSVDPADLKRAYRELALLHHPDKNPGDKAAEERFKELSEAYAILSDGDKRARYDRLGHAGIGGGAGGFEDFGVGAFTDLFENIFGDLLGRKKNKAAGRDLRYTLELEFVEAALGCDKSITFPARRECESCGGTGGKGGAAGLATCAECAGRGELKVQQGFFSLGKTCAPCSGTGKVVKDPCPDCKATGLIDKERSYTVTIPPGTEDGAVRRVTGQGEPGRRGGTPGDLQVAIRVKPHPMFKREGSVVSIDLPLSIAQAALGTLVEVPTLDGKVEMRIPAGTQSGAVFRLRGKGMPVGPKGSSRGDEHVRVVVETPSKLNPRQLELMQEVAAAEIDDAFPKRQEFRERLRELYGK